MERKPNITWRGVEPTDDQRALVEQKLHRIERYFDHLLRCEVAIEAPHQRHRTGNAWHVRVDLTVPGHELVVNREPGDNAAHAEFAVALRDAFNAAERMLKRQAAELRREIKHHDTPEDAVVSRLQREDGFGWLETPDGRDVWFHRNAVVVGAFDDLHEGDRVSFVEGDPEPGRGPQASTVRARGHA